MEHGFTYTVFLFGSFYGFINMQEVSVTEAIARITKLNVTRQESTHDP